MAAAGLRRNNAVETAPGRNCPLRRLCMEAHLDRRRVDAMPRHPLIEPPCAVCAQIAGEGTAEGDDLFDRLRHALCDLVRVEPAKPPADDGDGTKIGSEWCRKECVRTSGSRWTPDN